MKIVSFSISLAAFILYVSFSAAIVSTLTLEVVPINSFDTLKSSRLNLVGDVVVPKVATILAVTDTVLHYSITHILSLLNQNVSQFDRRYTTRTLKHWKTVVSSTTLTRGTPLRE